MFGRIRSRVSFSYGDKGRILAAVALAAAAAASLRLLCFYVYCRRPPLIRCRRHLPIDPEY